MKGCCLTLMTREGIRTYSYELGGPMAHATLARIVNDTNAALDPRYGETIVSIEVN